MDGTKIIKKLLLEKDINTVDLAKRLGCGTANLYNKYKRNNFSLNELEEIAAAVGCSVKISFENLDQVQHSEAPAQAPNQPVEAPKPSKLDILSPTPENLQIINFAWLKTNPIYKPEVAKMFGDEVTEKLCGMSEAEFKKLAYLGDS